LIKMIFYSAIFTAPISFLLVKYNYIFSWMGFTANVLISLVFITLGFYLVVLNKEEKNNIKTKIYSLKK
jgi:heme O synthase-like polyprenyltransferase